MAARVAQLLHAAALLTLLSCATQRQATRVSPDEFWAGLDSLNSHFRVAYSFYKNGDYQTAKVLFQNLIVEDSTVIHFQSFPFLADCYKRLGYQDSGLSVYNQGIQLLHARLKKIESSVCSKITPDLDELGTWRALYPQFPEALKEENGFVPYDDFTKPIRVRVPRYPYNALKAGIEGLVFLNATVTPDGIPINIGLVKTTDQIFVQPAMEALAQYRFSPPKVKGTPASICVVVPFRFKVTTR